MCCTEVASIPNSLPPLLGYLFLSLSISASLSPLVHPASSPKPLLALGTITKESRYFALERLTEPQPMRPPVSKGWRLSANSDAALTGEPGRRSVWVASRLTYQRDCFFKVAPRRLPCSSTPPPRLHFVHTAND